MKNYFLLPKFAVFLAAYNGVEYIFEQINSILMQKNVDVHIFISVDESSDGTESYLANLSSNESRITLLPFGDRFGSASVNFYRLIRDVNFVDFDFVCLSDQDDIWHPKKLYRAQDMLLKNKADGYSSNVIAFWVNGKRKFIDKAQPQQPWDFLFESAGPGCTYVLSKQLALSFQQMVQGSDGEILKIEYHDWLIYAFARANKFKWFIDSKPSMEYRQHKNNQVGVNIGWKSLWIRSIKTLHGHGFSQALLIANLLGLSSINIVKYGLRGKRFGYLRLAFYARLCRRKGEDQLRFFILCLLSFFINPAV
jgi:rhamnosyltransferase